MGLSIVSRISISVVSFCARARILINFFKNRCLSHTGPNCRQCEASNTLACKFLKKKPQIANFHNYSNVLNAKPYCDRLQTALHYFLALQFQARAWNYGRRWKTIKITQDIIPFHFQAGFWSTSSTSQPLVLASREGGCSKQGNFSPNSLSERLLRQLSKQTRVKHCNVIKSDKVWWYLKFPANCCLFFKKLSCNRSCSKQDDSK